MSTVADVEVLDFVEKSGQALHEASDLVEKIAADQVKVAGMIPAQVDALASTVILTKAGACKLILETEKQSAAEQLSTHAGALTVLGNLINILGEQKTAYDQMLVMSKQGSAVPSSNGSSAPLMGKQATAPTSGSNFVGRRAGEGEVMESDIPFMKLAGINR